MGVSVDQNISQIIQAKADYEQDLWGLSLGASYAISQNEDYQIDMVGGVRFWDLDNKLQLTGARNSFSLSAQESWQDAFVGLRGKAKLNKNWSVSGWGMTKIVGDSNKLLDFLVTMGYEYNNSLNFIAGYRYQEIDYNKNNFLFDVKLSGPVLGATFDF